MYHKPKLHDVTYIQGKTLQKEQRKEPAIKHSSRLTCETKKTVGHVHVGNEGDRGVNVGAPKKRSKFVPVTGSKDMSCVSVRLPGRHLCDCQAQQHALVNNCISCGRVVCEQEGAGPCAFCGSLVCSPADWEMVKSNSSRGKKLLEKLMNQKGQEHSAIRTSPDSQKDISISNKESLEKALEHRDKLLDFDRTSEKRTRVIDDEMDYFASDTNQWLSREERKALKSKEEDLHEMRHGSRRNRKVTLDFAGRRVKDEVEEATYCQSCWYPYCLAWKHVPCTILVPSQQCMMINKLSRVNCQLTVHGMFRATLGSWPIQQLICLNQLSSFPK
jgi:hypothetical protein